MNVLINETRIEKRLDEMAKQIDKDYEGIFCNYKYRNFKK